MLHHLSLRLRIFLFFALLALGGTLLIIIGLTLGYLRLDQPGTGAGFMISGLIASVALIGLCTWVWVLFDEHVARPVERLAAALRAKAHSDTDAALAAETARYLGDLAPAAATVAHHLTEARNAMAEEVARETAHLAEENARLKTLLAHAPTAMLLLTPDYKIALYNARAVALLPGCDALVLNRPIHHLFDPSPIRAALDTLKDHSEAPQFVARPNHSSHMLSASLSRLNLEGIDGYLLSLTDPDHPSLPVPARPLQYDFHLLHADLPADLADAPLSQLNFVVFDTETTGLNPTSDEICQIAAVRVVNGQTRPDERFDLLVDPGRKIPAASTKIHHITNDMVQGAPPPAATISRFHDFADNAVLIAHNAPFDMAFLRRREGEIGKHFSQPILDTVLLSAIIFGQSAEHTLDALCDRLAIEIPVEDRHTAIGDALGTSAAFVAMIPMLQAAGLETLGQTIAAFDRHARLIEHLN